MSYNKLDSLVANTKAIETAFRVKNENRKATEAEREALLQYTGFGGINYVLSMDKELQIEDKSVCDAMQSLKNILWDGVKGDKELYKAVVTSIKASVLTAFYTPSVLVTAIANQIQQTFSENNLTIGSFLETSAGIKGFLPVASCGVTKKVAFEKDLVSGLVLSALNPDTQVVVDGFETISSQDTGINGYDVIASNIPFGNLKVYDADFSQKGFPYSQSLKTIHNYFFIKAVTELKEGGILAFITSRGVADSPSNKFVREFLVHNANLITTLRLPDNLFMETSGIEVGSDLFILQKQSNKAFLSSREQQLLEVVKENVLGTTFKTEYINKIFLQPKYALATESSIRTNQYGKYVRKYLWKDTNIRLQQTLSKFLRSDFDKYFRKSLLVPSGTTTTITNGQYSLLGLFDTPVETSVQVAKEKGKRIYTDQWEQWMKEGVMVAFEGQLGNLHSKSANRLEQPQIQFVPISVTEKNKERAEDYFKVRYAYFQLSNAENFVQKAQPDLREKLNTLYDEFVTKWGYFHGNGNKEFILQDSLGVEILTLEMQIDNQIIKSDIMHEPVAFRQMDVVRKLLPLEALASSLNFYGKVDMSFISKSTEKSEQEIIEELTSEIFYNPLTDCWEEKNRFLAGDVVSKCKQLKTRLYEMSGQPMEWVETSVKALENVIPEQIPYEELEFNFGERWIPTEIYSQFAGELFKKETKILYFDVNDTYLVSLQGYSPVAYQLYSVRNLNGEALMVHALQDTVPELTKEIYKNGEKIRVPDEEAIQEAAAKIQEIREKFNQWLDCQPVEVRNKLVELYNERFNCYVRPQYDGSAQTFPNLSFEHFSYKDLYPSQKDAIWMIKQNNGGVCWHEVGAGKTMVMCVAAYEMKRLGLVQKPLIIGLKANVHQIADDFRKAYPMAKLLYPGKEDFTPANRMELFSKIKNNNWDCIILTHDQFAKIPQSEKTQIDLFEQELIDVELSLKALDSSGEKWNNRKLQNGLEKRQINLKAKLDELKDALDKKKDDSIDFHSMGIDHIFVDECQMFKNLMFQTRHNRVAGIGNTKGSQRAMNLLIAIRDIQKRTNKDLGATFLSGTVIVNALTELYVLFKYLRPKELIKQRVNCFDAWAAIFTKKTSDYELSVTGSIRRKERFRTYIKVPELASFLREITDYRTAEMINLDVPEKNVRFLSTPPTIEQEDMIIRLVSFARTGEWNDLGLDYPAPDNLDAAKMLIATDIARKMALDVRMLGNRFKDDPSNKASQCAASIYDYYMRSNANKGTQFVFSDLSTYKSKSWNIYQDIKDKLISIYGIPANEIQFIQTAVTEKARKRMIEKMNTGEIRVLFGSTSMLGTGVNAQQRAVAVHHLDIPWRPADLEQRNGRAVRKGNNVKLWGDNRVDVIIYGTEKTLDAYKFSLLVNKQMFINQINNGTIAVRRMDEDSLDENSGMNFAEFVAILSGNTDLLNKAKLDNKIMQLEKEQTIFHKEHYRSEKAIAKYREEIEQGNEFISRINQDISYIDSYQGDKITSLVGSQQTTVEETGKQLFQISKNYRSEELKTIGYYIGLKLMVKSEYHWTGYFERNSFFIEGKSGLKYRCGVSGSLPLGFKNAALYPQDTLDGIHILKIRKEKEIAGKENEIPVLEQILVKKWSKTDELAALKLERKNLQDRIDQSLKEEEIISATSEKPAA